jgi:hypothetical protein
LTDEETNTLMIEGGVLIDNPHPPEIIRVELKPEKLIKIQERIEYLSSKLYWLA